jgi:hypothetical protein
MQSDQSEVKALHHAANKSRIAAKAKEALPMLPLWPRLCCISVALWLLLRPGLCGDPMCLPMLTSMRHLWATIRGISFPFPVTSAL